MSPEMSSILGTGAAHGHLSWVPKSHKKVGDQENIWSSFMWAG